jgi:hypothetical protein
MGRSCPTVDRTYQRGDSRTPRQNPGYGPGVYTVSSASNVMSSFSTKSDKTFYGLFTRRGVMIVVLTV